MGRNKKIPCFGRFQNLTGMFLPRGLVIYSLPIKRWLHTFREANITGVTKHIKP